MTQRDADCAAKTDLWTVESLYDTMASNPDNIGSSAMTHEIYQCLKKRDLLPEPISEEEYRAMEVGDASGLSEEQILEKNRQWQRFFHQYMETDDNGAANPDYDVAKGAQFWQCQTDPLNQ